MIFRIFYRYNFTQKYRTPNSHSTTKAFLKAFDPNKRFYWLLESKNPLTLVGCDTCICWQKMTEVWFGLIFSKVVNSNISSIEILGKIFLYELLFIHEFLYQTNWLDSNFPQYSSVLSVLVFSVKKKLYCPDFSL